MESESEGVEAVQLEEQEVNVAARPQEEGEPRQASEMSPRNQHPLNKSHTASSESKSALESELEGVEAALPEELLLEEETA